MSVKHLSLLRADLCAGCFGLVACVLLHCLDGTQSAFPEHSYIPEGNVVLTLKGGVQ